MASLDAELKRLYDGLMKMDADRLVPKPPGRADWPGCVPPGEESVPAPTK